MEPEKINGRSPEQIKEAASICVSSDACQMYKCPYEVLNDCRERMIEDLLSLVHRLEEAQPKWISAEEPPKTDEWVAVWYRDKDGDCFPTAGRYYKHANGQMYWMTDVDDNEHAYPPAEITHWMPLPEPPKENKEENKRV